VKGTAWVRGGWGEVKVREACMAEAGAPRIVVEKRPRRKSQTSVGVLEADKVGRRARTA
jgi:hypothetical protein